MQDSDVIAVLDQGGTAHCSDGPLVRHSYSEKYPIRLKAHLSDSP